MSVFHIGSSLTMIKEITLDKEYNKDSILFLNSSNYNDQFDYEINKDKLKIYRIDKLEPHIISDNDFEKKNSIDIGTSDNYYKIVQLDRNYSLNAAIKLEPNPYNDNFLFKIYNDKLLIKRLDKNEGWCHQHKIKICEGWDNDLSGYISENSSFYYDIGTSDSHEKKIQLNGYYPEGCVNCIGSYPYSDRFIIKFINNELSFERYDRMEGWRYYHNVISKRRKIPKILLQTHYTDLPDNVRNHLKKRAYGWYYDFFKDDDIILFFQAHPMPEFPNIINIFNSMKIGAHKADLFRYYYLYIYGGVFLDSDAMIEKNLDDIVGNYNFVTVIGIDPSFYFNGFIATEPLNIILYDSIKEIYNYNIDELNNDYFKIIRDFKKITDKYKDNFNYKLYIEKGDWTGIMPTVDEQNNDELIFKHYYHSKVVPNDL